MPSFDEYRFFAESTQHLSERRQAATQTYLAVNTAIFTVLAFLVKDSGLSGWTLALISLPLFGSGVLVCIIWDRIIAQYKELIRWRYSQLIAMELELANSYRMYIKESEEFFKLKENKERFGFSRLEKWLPRLLLLLYTIYVVGLLVAAYAGWSLRAPPVQS